MWIYQTETLLFPLRLTHIQTNTHTLLYSPFIRSLLVVYSIRSWTEGRYAKLSLIVSMWAGAQAAHYAYPSDRWEIQSHWRSWWAGPRPEIWAPTREKGDVVMLYVTHLWRKKTHTSSLSCGLRETISYQEVCVCVHNGACMCVLQNRKQPEIKRYGLLVTEKHMWFKSWRLKMNLNR